MTHEQEVYLTMLTRSDSIYQELLFQCEQEELHYLRIREDMPEQDREHLDRYLALCEELDHRRLCLALARAKEGCL